MRIQLFIVSSIVVSVIGKPNFLFIIIDDLRPALGCYGDKNAYTPNIDLLARKSVVFKQAFAQQALCAPSRNSILTSRRPDTLQLYDFYSYWRNDVGNFTTLPQHLKNNGYNTMSIGKVFHPGVSSNGSDDSPYSWSEKPFHPFTDIYKDAPLCRNTKNDPPARNLVCPIELSMVPNKTLPDIETTKAAQTFLESHADDLNPFFLAVGFQKPHIPLKYPEEFLKYHPLDKFSVPKKYAWPKNVSTVAYNPWTDLRKRDDVAALHLKFPWQKIPNNFAKEIIQSYYASVSYIDHLIGNLLQHLKMLKLEENTIIILTSDHGWSLAEHADWAKYSNFEVALQVPLIITIPDTLINEFTINSKIEAKINWRKSDSANYKTSCNIVGELVELVDLFPTVAELAKFPIETCSESKQDSNKNLCSEGFSMLPLIIAAQQCKKLFWKKAAFSQYPRPNMKPSLHPNSDKPRLKEINIMGYSLRTKRYRYNIWLSFSPNKIKPNWDAILAEELYDHRTDNDENFNKIYSPEFFKVKKKLRKMLQRGWKYVSPY